MKKSDLEKGIWFRRRLTEFGIIVEDATYLREEKNNFMMLRANDRVMQIPKESVDFAYEDTEEISKIHIRFHGRYLGMTTKDFVFNDGGNPTEKTYKAMFDEISDSGKKMDREIYDHYMITENCSKLPVIDFHHYENDGWIYYKAKKLDLAKQSEEFRLGFEAALQLAIENLQDIVAEPGTVVIDAKTKEVRKVE